MKKLLFCAAMLLLSGLQALPVNAAAAAQPFVRWSVYSAHIDGPYFQEYNKAVQTMVTDKVLIVNKPQAVMLSGKNLK